MQPEKQNTIRQSFIVKPVNEIKPVKLFTISKINQSMNSRLHFSIL